jgi:hypothetical protein
VQADHNFAQTWTNCYNKGDITVTENVTVAGVKNQYMMIGGLCGTTRNEVAQSYTNCYNSGNITVEKGATFEVRAPFIGGCIGHVNRVIFTINNENGLRNIGNITVLNSETTNLNYTYVGGIAGKIENTTIPNAQSVCDVIAPNVTYLGMITGSSYTTVSGCKLGGKIAKALKDNGEPDFYDVVESEPEQEVEADGTPMPMEGQYIAYYKVIGNDEAADGESSGCSYISEIVIE